MPDQRAASRRTESAARTLVCGCCGEYMFSTRLGGCLSCYASAEDQPEEPGEWNQWGTD